MPAANDTVLLAYVHGVEVAYSWHASMMNLIAHDVSHHQRIIRGGYHGVRYGTGGIVDARNKVAMAFLADQHGPDWLFWIDTDMGFAPDTVDALVAAAHPEDRPVVGGLCFVQHEHAQDGMSGFRTNPLPTVYRWYTTDDGGTFGSWPDYPRDQLVQCEGTGSACILIHRSALQRVVDEYGLPYAPMLNNGKVVSEDLSFCARLGQLGIPLHVDTRVKTTHLKRQWVAEEDLDLFLAATKPSQEVSA